MSRVKFSLKLMFTEFTLSKVEGFHKFGLHLICFRGHTEGETPVPIPNTAVKPFRADGTCLATGWESRSLRRHFFSVIYGGTGSSALGGVPVPSQPKADPPPAEMGGGRGYPLILGKSLSSVWLCSLTSSTICSISAEAERDNQKTSRGITKNDAKAS